MRRLSCLLLTLASLGLGACDHGEDRPRPEAGDPSGDPGHVGDPGRAGDPLPYADADRGDAGSPGDELHDLTVDWGTISPAMLTWELGATPATAHVEVYEAGITEADGAGTGLAVEVGVGPVASDPSQDANGWQFVAATYAGVGPSSTNNDSYRAALPTLVAGTYAWVGRASLDGGVHWTFLDADGGNGGFDPARLGSVSVVGLRVDWARLLTPPNAAKVLPGAPVAARVQVYELEVTAGAGQGADLEVQVGAGPRGGDPATADFTYGAAIYGRDVDGGGTLADDEYDWLGVAPTAVGAYDLVARVRRGAGPWLYADTSGSSGSDDPYDAASALALEVQAQPTGGVVDWCQLQAPTGETVLAPGAATLVYGRVHATALPGPAATTGPTGTGPTPRGQVGIGPRGSLPPAGWSWGELGAFNLWPDNANDEQMARLVAPTAVGDYDWTWRFSMDGGVTWLYCDDNDQNPAAEYWPANAGWLKVQ